MKLEIGFLVTILGIVFFFGLVYLLTELTEHIDGKCSKRKLIKAFKSIEIGSRWVFKRDDPDPFIRKATIVILDKKMGTDGKTPFVKYKYEVSELESTSDIESFLRVFLKLNE